MLQSLPLVTVSLPLDFFELTCGLLPDVAARNIQTRCQIPVNKSLRAGAIGHRAESQFGLPGDPDLPDEYNIERRIEYLGNLEADRDPTARQCQDDRLSVFQMRQFIGKPAAGVAAICEFHATTSPK
jgi:hypothetical protein